MRTRRSGVGWMAAAAALALGAPAGWLAIRMYLSDSARADPTAELSEHAALYAYLLGSTLIVFVAFATLLGILVDRLRTANRSLRELIMTDPLTGLRNPRYFQDRIREECIRGDRQRTPLVLVTIDLDRFKAVNDAHGHAVGDRALQHAARVLAAASRASDVLCRVGGEEFVVICPNTDQESGCRAAERLRAALAAEPFVHGSLVVPVTGSFGVSVRAPDAPLDLALAAADRALYLSKERGRNRVEAMQATA